MLQWLHNRKIARRIRAIEKFVSIVYRDPPNPPAPPEFPKPPEDPQPAAPKERTIQYSMRDPNPPCDGPRISDCLLDHYNQRSIAELICGLSSLPSPDKTLQEIDKYTNMSFVEKLCSLIENKDLRHSSVYKAAQIDRRLFSKILSDRSYTPAKDTCIALCLALHLNSFEAEDLLSRAGYVLSHSSKRDVVIEYFFRQRIYSLNTINEVLFYLGLKTIGR